MTEFAYEGVLKPHQVEMVVGRAKRMGFRGEDLRDAVQQVAFDASRFQYDPAKANGASQDAVLASLADCRLRHIRRAAARHEARKERLRELPPAYQPAPDTLAIDVQDAVAALPRMEQDVCLALAEGLSQDEVAQRLGCGWHTIERLVGRIREHFRKLGLGR